MQIRELLRIRNFLGRFTLSQEKYATPFLGGVIKRNEVKKEEKREHKAGKCMLIRGLKNINYRCLEILKY
jgi:hypothetical protein